MIMHQSSVRLSHPCVVELGLDANEVTFFLVLPTEHLELFGLEWTVHVMISTHMSVASAMWRLAFPHLRHLVDGETC